MSIRFTVKTKTTFGYREDKVGVRGAVKSHEDRIRKLERSTQSSRGPDPWGFGDTMPLNMVVSELEAKVERLSKQITVRTDADIPIFQNGEEWVAQVPLSDGTNHAIDPASSPDEARAAAEEWISSLPSAKVVK